jgi:hypothetical protein
MKNDHQQGKSLVPSPKPTGAKKEDVVPEVGALREWHRELHNGLRIKFEFDSLWRAACAEANARDYLRQGMVAAANDERRKAAEIILGAVVAGAT